MCLLSQNGSTAFRLRHRRMGQGWLSGLGGRGGEGVGIFSLQGIWVELQQEAQGPDDSFIFQGALNWEKSDFSQLSISFSYFLLKIKSVRQVAGDLPQMESSCTSVLRCYLIQSNAHQ